MTDVFNRFWLCRANLVTFAWLCCNTGGSEQATPCYFLCGPGDAESGWCRCRKGFRSPQPRIATGSIRVSQAVMHCENAWLIWFILVLCWALSPSQNITEWQLITATGQDTAGVLKDEGCNGGPEPRDLGASGRLGAPRGLGFFVSKGSCTAALLHCCTARLVTWSRFWNLYLGQKQQLLRTRPVWCLAEHGRTTTNKRQAETRKEEAWGEDMRRPLETQDLSIKKCRSKRQQKTILHMIAVPQYDDGPIRHWDLSFN